MKESELAELFIDYFNEGYQVYPEVPCGGGIVDFVATDGTIVIGCEVKTSFGLAVIEQAYRKRHCFHYTYICVPSRPDYHFREVLIRPYRIGVLTVDKHNRISENQPPKLNRSARPPKLREYMKQSTAGSQSDRVTAFGHTVNQIKRCLRRRGDTHINDVLAEIDYHYNTVSTAKSSLRRWIKQGVIEGIEWDRAVLRLKEDI